MSVDLNAVCDADICAETQEEAFEITKVFGSGEKSDSQEKKA